MLITNSLINDIFPYPNNPRVNNKAINHVAASIKLFGFRQPIVVDKDKVIIAGHTRWKAAQKLGLKEVPIHIAEDLTPEQVKAYRLADNRTAELSEWNKDLLHDEILSLPNIDIPGFTPDDIARILNKEDSDDSINNPPDPPQQPKSQFNSIYQLGRHKVICGDSTDNQTIRRLMGNEQADLLLTDPPYGVGYTGGGEATMVGGAGKAQAKGNNREAIANDDLDDKEFTEFLTLAFHNAIEVLKPGGSFYIWYGEGRRHNFFFAIQNSKLQVREVLIWAKNKIVIGRQDYQWQHEPVLYGWKDGAAHTWETDRCESTLLKAPEPWHFNKTDEGYSVVLEGETYIITGNELRIRKINTTLIACDRPLRSDEHPTMKPVQLFERLILNSSKPEAIILDPFCGSGTTVIACERNNRKARVVEFSPNYVDVIRKRWAEHVSGKDCDWETLTPEIK